MSFRFTELWLHSDTTLDFLNHIHFWENDAQILNMLCLSLQTRRVSGSCCLLCLHGVITSCERGRMVFTFILLCLPVTVSCRWGKIHSLSHKAMWVKCLANWYKTDSNEVGFKLLIVWLLDNLFWATGHPSSRPQCAATQLRSYGVMLLFKMSPKGNPASQWNPSPPGFPIASASHSIFMVPAEASIRNVLESADDILWSCLL